MNRSTAKNVVMEQRADIRVLNAIGQALPTLKRMTEGNHQNVGGVAVTMLGPFHIQFIDGSKEHEPAIMEIEGGEQHELMLLRDVKDDLPEIDEGTLKKFEPVFHGLPEPKLESTVRLVVEMAHRQDSSPASVAKVLNCSLYKARSVMQKFGLSS